jgi:DNA-binding NarL/FixJ family response regulator
MHVKWRRAPELLGIHPGVDFERETMNLHIPVNELDHMIGPPNSPITTNNGEYECLDCRRRHGAGKQTSDPLVSQLMPITILSVEDHPVFREGLSAILGSQPDMHLVAQAENAVEAIEEFRRLRPDVTLMDLRLAGSNGIDTLIAIRGEFPKARIIMLTTSDSDGEIQRALRAGASAYILKSMPKKELLEVIRSVHAGRRAVPPDVAAVIAEHFGEEELTARELEVLRLIHDGYRNKQIADRLAIAETTVNFHIKNIVSKLSANDRTHAVTIAVRRGLLQV